MVYKTDIKVRYAETDQMGVVYYANYYVWFEVGRTELLASLGCRYSDMEANGVLLPVRSSSCTYHASAHYEDELTVETEIIKLKGARIVFAYRVMRGEELLSEGKTEHAFVDRTGKLVKAAKNPLLQKVFAQTGLL